MKKSLVSITLVMSALLALNAAMAGATWDGASWDGSSWDGSTWDGSNWDASTWDASQWDASQWDASQWDASRWDASQWDAARWDAARWDAARWDASRWDASRWDASQWDASRWDAARWDSFTGYDGLYPYQWNLRAINVPGAWAMIGPGDGTLTACVLDSGLEMTHPDMATQLWTDPATGAHGYDFVSRDADPSDAAGHGTHVASILAARSGDGGGIAGIANVRVMTVRVVDDNGNGTDADLAAGIRYCVDHGAKILSLSLTVDDRSKEVTNAVKHAADNGAIVVASAGNTPCKSPCTSALLKPKSVLSVTAMAPDGALASFGSWTPRTDIAAPGVQIPGAFLDGTWIRGTGTSQAVPHVAGVAALVWYANPSLTANEVADILTSSAMHMGEPSKDVRVVDAAAAVAKALAPPK